ncbi:MAG: hypothetical protein HYW78_00095 [Parcubacteria group bacterium]|nr:hypothetical protein [Parcubacteria group bacterium]
MSGYSNIPNWMRIGKYVLYKGKPRKVRDISFSSVAGPHNSDESHVFIYGKRHAIDHYYDLQPMTIYFAHPINTYNTELENKLLRAIAKKFPKWQIENPNQWHHQESVRIYKQEGKNPMEYFYKEVLPDCAIGIILPFRDGAYGAGVFGEAEFLVKQGCPLYQITHRGIIKKISIDNIVFLSVEETRHRVRTPEGQTKPY